MLWKSPIYRFRTAVSHESEYLYEVIFDVTGSAIPDLEVGEIMKGVWKQVLADHGNKISTVLDFGAGKFRNTLHFLDEGKEVTAVEFKEMPDKSPDAKKMLKKCSRKKNFTHLIFPSPFIEDTQKHDLIIIVNVVPVMPVFAERLALLDILYDKVEEKKFILWYTMHEGSYKKIREEGKFDFADGLWRGENKTHKTFYRFHSRDDIREMFALYGFKFIKPYPAPGNDAMLFQKTSHNLFRGLITPKKILEAIPQEENFEPPTVKFKKVKKSKEKKEILPNPYCLSLEKLYSDALMAIPPGKEGSNPEKYHRLISQIVLRIFRGSLRNMDIKPDMFHKLYILDTVYSDAGGIFTQILQNSGFNFSYILLEAKNLTFDPENDEFNQIFSRLSDDIGDFGLLVCRTIQDKALAKKHCETILTTHSKLVIVLTDEDILTLLGMRSNSDDEGIYDFMDTKIRSIRFRSTN